MSYSPKHPGPIRVAAAPGRHILVDFLDRRLVAEPLEAAPTADIVLVPFSRLDAAAEARALLTPQILSRVVAGEAILVLDHCGEGRPLEIKPARVMHQMLASLGVSPGRVVFITQNRDYARQYAAFCRAAEVEPMTVLTYDLYIRDFFREHETDGEATFAARKAQFEARGATRDKRFVCLNFSARPTKVLLLLKLIAGGQFDQGFISFPGFDKELNARAIKKGGMIFDLLMIPGLEDVGAELSPLMDELERKGGAVLGPVRTATGMPNHFKSVAGDMALEEYNRVWFSVVTETEMHGARRVTEKPFKALANFSPAILLGNPFSLDLLREFGFRTFEGLFDESYDRERDPRRRFEAVYDEIARLCSLPETKLRDAEAALAETLTFNAHRALVEMPGVYRDELEPRLIDQLMDLRG